ncbi:MAG: hypothetical protein ACLR2E_04940 [Lachnospiraceae bacterium]
MDEQAEMEKWTSEGKNPALKLQARPATNDTTAAPSAAMETPTSAKPAEAELPPNRQSRRQSPRIGTRDIGSVPETDGPF